MKPGKIELEMSTNADLHDLQPVIDANGAAVDMTSWPFKLELKFDENDAGTALDVTVTVNALGELLFAAPMANIAPLLIAPRKKMKLVGDLLCKPWNGSYIAKLADVEAIVKKGTSTL